MSDLDDVPLDFPSFLPTLTPSQKEEEINEEEEPGDDGLKTNHLQGKEGEREILVENAESQNQVQEKVKEAESEKESEDDDDDDEDDDEEAFNVVISSLVGEAPGRYQSKRNEKNRKEQKVENIGGRGLTFD